MPPRSSRLNTVVVLGTALLMAWIPTAARAATWFEAGDAGDLIATTQPTSVIGSLDGIQGQIDTADDVDLYCVQITNPGLFSAAIGCTSFADLDLWLFGPSGIGLTHNDACAASLVLLTGTYVPGPGTYVLGISYESSTAIGLGAQPIWNPVAVSGERAPDDAGAPGPLVGWGPMPRILVQQPYQIALTGCLPCDVATSSAATSWGRVRSIYR